MFQVKFDEENKVWDSCHVPLVFNDKISIGHALLRSMLLNGPKIAQISDDTGEQLTFEELRLRTIRSAQNLQKRGIKTNQVIGIMVENVAHLSPIIFSALCLGCPINALHSKAEKIDIIRMFKLTEPSIILCDVNAYDLVAESFKELGIDAKIFTFHGTKGTAEPVESLFEETGNEDDFVPAEIDAEKHIASIMRSSGTTGLFKGVTISHAALIACVSSYNIVNASDIFFVFSAMHWVTCLVFLLMGTINGATRIITTEAFSPERQVRIMEKYKVTFTFIAAFYLVQILKSGVLAGANLSSVKKCFFGGSKVSSTIRNKISYHLPNARVCNCYGLTELATSLTADFSKYTDKDTVGRILNGFKVKIIDEHGNRCGVDVDGEIYIKGRHQFLGYYKNEELTKQTLDEEGFFITGDIGHIDKEGFVYIVDRKKDVIMYDDRIAPSDIEAVLLESPDIAEACAVGVPHDPVVEFPAVAVIRATGSTISESDVSKLVTDNLGQCCKLRGGVYFLESLPKTSSGKILRGAVKERITELFKVGLTEKDDFVPILD